MPQTNFLDAPELPPTAAAVATSPPNRFADARPLTACDRCGAARFADRRIHGGASSIRECARCGCFMGFPRWYETGGAGQ